MPVSHAINHHSRCKGFGHYCAIYANFPMYSVNGVCCYTEHVLHRPRAVAVVQRVCAPTLRLAQLVGLGFVEGQGL